MVGKSNINILIFALSQLSKTIKSIFFHRKRTAKNIFCYLCPLF
ncbi:hypothetical protein HMPREF2533_02857 [Bacteroides fragilis]|nr:hypothetical protein HMPREF2530_02857 [Bacteroides fragilis]KXU44212.1 hypothetical protein HMPREF2533_02857 [Bacteroides fragilis]